MPEAQTKSHTGLWVTVVVVLSVLFIAATSVAVWQFMSAQKIEDERAAESGDASSQVTQLTEENKQLKEDLEKARKADQDQADSERDAISTADLPVVVFQRGGLLSESEFEALQDEFMEMVIDPIAAYAEDQGHTLLTVNIEIPQEAGAEFIYDAIYDDGVNEGALYGKRGEPLDWWTPQCIDECEFSDEFRENFPDVIDAYEGTL